MVIINISHFCLRVNFLVGFALFVHSYLTFARQFLRSPELSENKKVYLFFKGANFKYALYIGEK